MSDKKKYPRADALAVAAELVQQLRPCAERIEVAGSLRRGKAEVGDVELLFVPKKAGKRDELFREYYDAADAALFRWSLEGVLSKRPSKVGVFTWGPENKLAVHVASGIPVDFFSTDSLRWWNALVVRTGGKQNNLLITTTAQRQGWTFEAYGAGFHKLSDPAERHDTTSERDVFEFIGLKYLEPEDRA